MSTQRLLKPIQQWCVMYPTAFVPDPICLHILKLLNKKGADDYRFKALKLNPGESRAAHSHQDGLTIRDLIGSMRYLTSNAVKHRVADLFANDLLTADGDRLSITEAGIVQVVKS